MEHTSQQGAMLATRDAVDAVGLRNDVVSIVTTDKMIFNKLKNRIKKI